jgi:deoxyribodipyrimidine photo-lyase
MARSARVPRPAVPALRIRAVNRAPVRAEAQYVLYWMIATRRTHDNFALDRAIEHAVRLHKPLVVLEALRVAYPYASDRLHRFVIDGMADNARAFRRAGIAYHAYVEPEVDAGKGLLSALSQQAALVVTDDFPCFFVPRMLAAAGRTLGVLLEAVDSNGILPIRALEKASFRAFDFRRFVQRTFAEQWALRPAPAPLSTLALPKLPFPKAIAVRWPAASAELLSGSSGALAALPIDHGVPVVNTRGGLHAGKRVLAQFLDDKLERYEADRNHPDRSATSGLSPYLHFGHLSAQRIVSAIGQREDWTIDALGDRARGERTGFWRMRPSAEAFLDQLITWRELGLNYCAHERDYMSFASLPNWAQRTLHLHRGDARAAIYTRAELEGAKTHDALWNAAQRELVQDGRMHNYLRMLWGKKILEWSRSPEEALASTLYLNDRYALDGRDPNSYSGILWCYGRYDRAWGPERAIFGSVRYMSSANAEKKLWLANYLVRYGDHSEESRSSAR